MYKPLVWSLDNLPYHHNQSQSNNRFTIKLENTQISEHKQIDMDYNKD